MRPTERFQADGEDFDWLLDPAADSTESNGKIPVIHPSELSLKSEAKKIERNTHKLLPYCAQSGSRPD
jgi:hypothetical protein